MMLILTKRRSLLLKFRACLHISSSYAKILGEIDFQPREIPRSGSKAKYGKEEEKRRKTESW